MNNHAGVNFDSAYGNHVFKYKRSIKLPQGKGLSRVPETFDRPCRPRALDVLIELLQKCNYVY